MDIIIILMICSLTVSTAFLVGFLWAARSGQYDDVTTPAMRVLFDDEQRPELQPSASTHPRGTDHGNN